MGVKCINIITTMECQDVLLARQLQDALSRGDFGVRDALGVRFYKDFRAGGKDNIKVKEDFINKLKNEGKTANEAKRLFRMEWAKKTLEKVNIGKHHSKTWEEVDADEGVYDPFAVLRLMLIQAIDDCGITQFSMRLATANGLGDF